jgi:hypothetical protein
VAFVDANAPADSKPGDSYDAVATISAWKDAFPTGTVRVHAEVVAPHVSFPSSIDFGDVPAGRLAARSVRFFIDSPSAVSFTSSFSTPTPFSLGAPSHAGANFDTTVDWVFQLQPSPPGDYTVEATWTVSPAFESTLPSECLATSAITLHAHVVDPDGGADGGADLGNDASD